MNSPGANDALFRENSGESTSARSSSGPSVMSAPYQFSLGDHHAAFRCLDRELFGRFLPWWWAGAIVLGALWATHVYVALAGRFHRPPISLLLFEASILVLLIVPWFRRRAMIRSIESMCQRDPERLLAMNRLTIDGSGITTESGESEIRRNWNELRSVRFGEDFVFLLFKNRTFQYIPLRVFPAAHAALDQLVVLAQTNAPHAFIDASVAYVSPESAQLIRTRNLPAEEKMKNYARVLTILFVLFGALGTAAVLDPAAKANHLAFRWMLAWYGILGGVAGLAIYCGVRQMAPWARIPLIILSFAAMVLFPIGTFFGIRVLTLISADISPPLLTLQYKNVVNNSQGTVRRTSPMAWVALFLICILILAVVVIARLPPEVRHLR